MLKSFNLFLNESLSEEELIEKNLAHMSPDEHKLYRQNEVAAGEWHQKHPVHHMNIVHHYNQSTEGERSNGHSWYHGAHHIAKAIAHDTKTPVHAMAGLISNYSPQTHWHTNIHTAAMVARDKRAR